MSYIPQIKGVSEDKWTGNGLRFATAGEAINYCIELQGRSMGCKDGPRTGARSSRMSRSPTAGPSTAS